MTYATTQYLVFAGDDYYPCGGFSDFHGQFDSVEDAKESLQSLNSGRWRGWEWAQIVERDEDGNYGVVESLYR